MALTTTPAGKPLTYGLINQSAASNTADKNIRNGSTTLYSLNLIETGNVDDDWLKVFDDNGDGFVAGTTEPDLIFPVIKNTTVDVDIPGGLKFDEGLTWFGAEEDGKGATTAPDALAINAVTS